MNKFFALWDKKLRTVTVMQSGDVEVCCLPENNTVSIWNKHDQSCVVITVETWNSFAQAKHRLPTMAQWQKFWSTP